MYSPNCINVSVPIRRDDASTLNDRYIQLKFYINIVKQLIDCLANYSYEFHIYSLASKNEAEEITKAFQRISDRIKFHINEPAMKVMHHLIMSDILIVDHSSFPQMAGFISKNIKLYHPHGYTKELKDDT